MAFCLIIYYNIIYFYRKKVLSMIRKIMQTCLAIVLATCIVQGVSPYNSNVTTSQVMPTYCDGGSIDVIL